MSDSSTEIDACPKEIDICVSSDSKVELQFTITDADDNPIDISADDIKFTVKSDIAGTCEISTKTSLAGAHEDGPNGVVVFTVSKTDLAGASSRIITCWVYEVSRCIGAVAADEVVYIQGTFMIKPRVGTC